MRVWVTIAFDAGRRTATEAVILLGNSDGPYQVLSWRDDFDAPALLRQAGKTQ